MSKREGQSDGDGKKRPFTWKGRQYAELEKEGNDSDEDEQSKIPQKKGELMQKKITDTVGLRTLTKDDWENPVHLTKRTTGDSGAGASAKKPSKGKARKYDSDTDNEDGVDDVDQEEELEGQDGTMFYSNDQQERASGASGRETREKKVRGKLARKSTATTPSCKGVLPSKRKPSSDEDEGGDGGGGASKGERRENKVSAHTNSNRQRSFKGPIGHSAPSGAYKSKASAGEGEQEDDGGSDAGSNVEENDSDGNDDVCLSPMPTDVKNAASKSLAVHWNAVAKHLTAIKNDFKKLLETQNQPEKGLETAKYVDPIIRSRSCTRCLCFRAWTCAHIHQFCQLTRMNFRRSIAGVLPWLGGGLIKTKDLRNAGTQNFDLALSLAESKVSTLDRRAKKNLTKRRLTSMLQEVRV